MDLAAQGLSPWPLYELALMCLQDPVLYRLYEVLVVYGVSPLPSHPKTSLTSSQYSYKALIAEKVTPHVLLRRIPALTLYSSATASCPPSTSEPPSSERRIPRAIGWSSPWTERYVSRFHMLREGVLMCVG